MRIISGKLKGRTLRLPQGIRATSDKVRKALFDILGERVVYAEVLDLFAGSGGLGIEALSRGVKSVIFIEKDRRCCRMIEANLLNADFRKSNADKRRFYSRDNLRLSACNLRESALKDNSSVATVLALDVFKAIPLLFRQGHRCDLIFLDPPYYKGMVKKSLQTLLQYDILRPNGLIVAEHYKKDELLQTLGALVLLRQERYGDTVLSFYQLNPLSTS